MSQWDRRLARKLTYWHDAIAIDDVVLPPYTNMEIRTGYGGPMEMTITIPFESPYAIECYDYPYREGDEAPW